MACECVCVCVAISCPTVLCVWFLSCPYLCMRPVLTTSAGWVAIVGFISWAGLSWYLFWSCCQRCPCVCRAWTLKAVSWRVVIFIIYFWNIRENEEKIPKMVIKWREVKEEWCSRDQLWQRHASWARVTFFFFFFPWLSAWCQGLDVPTYSTKFGQNWDYSGGRNAWMTPVCPFLLTPPTPQSLNLFFLYIFLLSTVSFVFLFISTTKLDFLDRVTLRTWFSPPLTSVAWNLHITFATFYCLENMMYFCNNWFSSFVGKPLKVIFITMFTIKLLITNTHIHTQITPKILTFADVICYHYHHISLTFFLLHVFC